MDVAITVAVLGRIIWMFTPLRLNMTICFIGSKDDYIIVLCIMGIVEESKTRELNL
jgi:hypothetical protein